MKSKPVLISILFIALISPSLAAINSVDQINYDSNGDFFNGPVFTMDFTADGSTDEVNVFVPSSDLSSAAGTGDAKADISIDATNTETKAEYSFLNEDGPNINQHTFEDFYLEKIKSDFSSESEYYNYVYNEVDGKCFDGGDNGISDDIAFKSGVINGWNVDTLVHCVSVRKIESVGEISSNPNAIFSTDWEISSDGETVSTTVSNGETGDGISTRVGDDVIIQWKGSIGTGKNAPVPTDEKIAYSNDAGYTVIDADDYDDYTDYLGGGTIEDLMVKTMKGQITGGEAESRLNDASGKAQDPHPNTEFDSVQFDGSSVSDGSMELGIDNLAYPEFDIYANACETDSGSSCDAFVQIEKSVGVPGNLNVNNPEWDELGEGNIKTSFTNVGEGEGRFSVRVSDTSDGFSFSGSAETVNLEPGESTTVYLPVTGESSRYENKEVEGTATVEVTETSSGETVKATSYLTLIQEDECTRDNKWVKTIDGKETVLKCSEDGLSTVKVLVCDTDEYADQTSTGYQCFDDEEPPVKPECGLDPICHIQNALEDTFNRFGSILGTFDILVSAAVTLLSFGWASRNISDFIVGPLSEVTRFTKQQLNIVLSGVTALTVGYFAFVVISSIVVKILLAVGIVAYIYLKSSIGIIGQILLGGSD